MVAQENRHQACQACYFSGLWLYHSLLGGNRILRIFAQLTMMLIVHCGLQRSPKGVEGPCLLWPTFSTVNVPFLLCLGLTRCWVSYTININVYFLCTTPGLSQSYLQKACTKLKCISKRKQKEFLMSTTILILQNDLVCSVLF